MHLLTLGSRHFFTVFAILFRKFPSLPGTPASSAHMDNNSSSFHFPLLTPQIKDFKGEIHELLEYPYPPHDPHVSTTRPLQYPLKHHTGSRHISELYTPTASGFTKSPHTENRHSWPYPSPTRAPTSASHSHSVRTPRRRDNLGIGRSVQENSRRWAIQKISSQVRTLDHCLLFHFPDCR